MALTYPAHILVTIFVDGKDHKFILFCMHLTHKVRVQNRNIDKYSNHACHQLRRMDEVSEKVFLKECTPVQCANVRSFECMNVNQVKFLFSRIQSKLSFVDAQFITTV